MREEKKEEEEEEERERGRERKKVHTKNERKRERKKTENPPTTSGSTHLQLLMLRLKVAEGGQHMRIPDTTIDCIPLPVHRLSFTVQLYSR